LLIGCGDRVEWSVHAVTDDRGRPTGELIPAYNHVLGSGGAKLLPFDLIADERGKAEAKEPQSPFVMAPGSAAQGSFVKGFRDAPYGPALAEVTATKRFRLREAGPGSAGGRVLLRMTDGGAFVAARTFGDGEVVLVTTSLDLRSPDPDAKGYQEPPWSTFAARPKAFVPFLQLTAAALSGRKLEVPEEPRTAGQSL